jgi:hypothetical protein
MVGLMDNEVTITLVFHAMGDDPIEVANRCLAFFDPSVPHTVDPQEMTVAVKPRLPLPAPGIGPFWLVRGGISRSGG